VRCKYLKEYSKTPDIRYDCEKIYDLNGRKNLDDMIHFNDLKGCENCKHRKIITVEKAGVI